MAIQVPEGVTGIEGVRGFNTGEYASSVHGAQACILETLGEPMTYADLIGYSGFAFRVGLHNQMCPSAGHPCCGYMCLDNGVRAIPWKLRMFDAFPEGKKRDDLEAFRAEACAAIKESIDRGVPVHYGSEEDGVIIGYADEGRRWWCVHPYHKNGAEGFWYDEVKGFAGGEWPWAIVVWERPKTDAETADEGALLRAALEQAADMWRTTEMRGDYYSGDTAYAQWIEWLRGVEKGEVENPKGGMQGNGWGFDVLVQSRRIAGEWLAAKGAEMGGEAGERLCAAAREYARIPGICMEGIKCSWDLALPPKRFEEWTSEMREKEMVRLEAARACDEKAIGEIEKALAVW